MYLPKHFEQPDTGDVARLLAHPLATLVWPSADTLSAEAPAAAVGPRRARRAATARCARGHVARANPVWREAADAEVLAVFQGPQAYLTPSWYPSKAANPKVVPTWNYAVVHLHGRLRISEDADGLRVLVERLTDTHEALREVPPAHRWQVSDAPADYVEQMLRAIVGIEVEVTSVQAKWKASQNRSAGDRTGVAAGLESLPSDAAHALAALVRRGGAAASR
jgi:transcriptional regulator